MREVQSSVMQDFFGRWGKEGVVNLIDEMSELIIMTASRTLMGAAPAAAGVPAA